MNDSIQNVAKIQSTDPKFVQEIKMGKPLDYSSKNLRTLKSKNINIRLSIENYSHYRCSDLENCVLR